MTDVQLVETKQSEKNGVANSRADEATNRLRDAADDRSGVGLQKESEKHPLDLRLGNQFIASGIGSDAMHKVITPYLDAQASVQDFFASKGFKFTNPRMQEEFNSKYSDVQEKSEADIMKSLTPEQKTQLGDLVKHRSECIAKYLEYKAANPITDKNSAELLPHSNDTKLTPADIEKQLVGINVNQRADALELMQKEIEAKSGRKLVDDHLTGWPDLDAYFGHKTWYKITYDAPNAKLSPEATANLQTLKEMERGYRQNH